MSYKTSNYNNFQLNGDFNNLTMLFSKFENKLEKVSKQCFMAKKFSQMWYISLK